MDLTITDVADLLNTSEWMIAKVVGEGKIPCYRIDDSYRFSRVEIEDWVLKNKNIESTFNNDSEEDSRGKGGSKQFSLYRAIRKGGLLHQVAGDTKAKVIGNAMKTIAKDLGLDVDVLTELLLDREALQPTSLNNGIGLPHTRDSFVSTRQDHVVIAFPERPIEDYGALDGEPVHTLFFLFASDDKRHLHLLAKIAHLTNQPETIELLKSKPNKLKLLEYIRAWEAKL